MSTDKRQQTVGKYQYEWQLAALPRKAQTWTQVMSVSVSISTIHPNSYFRLTYCWMDGVTILVSATLSTEGLLRGHDAHCALVLALHWARAVNPGLQCRWLQLIVPQYQSSLALSCHEMSVISTLCAPDKNIIHNGDRKPTSRHPRCCSPCSRHCFSTFRRFPQNIPRRDIKADILMSGNGGVSSYDVIVCLLIHSLATFKLLPCQKLTDYGKIVTQLTII